jgi:hypothetical protein
MTSKLYRARGAKALKGAKQVPQDIWEKMYASLFYSVQDVNVLMI